MASASSSTSIPPPPQPPTSSSYTYHVFLSYRGPDTGKGFTNHLNAALNRKGIRTYKDDKKLRIGDVISDELVKAIEESMFAVTVFSPDFASSSWCLDEVCKIVECKNKQRLQMVEVFYHVKPCDVRHQIGTFREAFLKHERDGRHDSEKIQRWRDALKQVTEHSGWTSNNHPDEAVLVENVAQHIFEILIPKLPSSMKNLVGIESRVEQVISQIGLGLNDVRYIGICGMGGIGKTTIARAVYETIRSRFEVTCFLADVRDQCEKKDIVHVQKQLLDQMHIGSAIVYNEYDGRTIIQNSLRLKKVLLVLDDVNHEKQLENLAGKQDWFGSGSRIIITTRDMRLIKKQGVHETYNVKGLEESKAFNLFCSKAFDPPEPLEEFLDLSKEVVNYSGGLPLALKVLGSYLKDRPVDVWKSAIEKIKKYSHSEIIDVLKISYDDLDFMVKNIFLDITCFFKGWKIDEVTEILKECGYHAEDGIDNLINKSLVTLEQTRYEGTVVGMHDLVEEMGKQIVIEESPKDASKRSRLWCHEDIDSVLAQRQDIEATQSMVLRMDRKYTGENWRYLDIRGSSFSKLQLLILDGVKAPILCNIPSTLKVLRWKKCPLDTLALTDQRSELVEIDLSDSEIVQLWDGKKFLYKLEYLNLSSCYKLKETPDLSMAPNLKRLNLRGCGELNYIHASLAHHKSLVALNLGDCGSLETLGDKLEMSSLEELYLSNCTSLRRLPEFGDCMKKLSILVFIVQSQVNFGAFDRSGILLSLGCSVGIKKFVFIGCSGRSCMIYIGKSLGSLTVRGCPESQSPLLGSLSHVTSLTSLALHECFDTSKEPTPYYDLVRLALLTDLDLSGNHFLRVPINIHKLPKLTRLQLNHCSKLEVLPKLPSSLRELHVLGCGSLDASHVTDVISKACCGFAESATQDPEDILHMWISGKEIPAWFDHLEEDTGISISFPHTFPSTETLALALCFQFKSDDSSCSDVSTTVICNGKEFINKSLLKMLAYTSTEYMCIVCVNSYYLSKLLCQPNRFHLLTPHRVVQRCGARWVCKQDIQGFKKTSKMRRKPTLLRIMDIISDCSPSRNKMHVVDPPLYEEDKEHVVASPLYEEEDHVVAPPLYEEDKEHVVASPLYEEEDHVDAPPLYEEDKENAATAFGEKNTHWTKATIFAKISYMFDFSIKFIMNCIQGSDM